MENFTKTTTINDPSPSDHELLQQLLQHSPLNIANFAEKTQQSLAHLRKRIQTLISAGVKLEIASDRVYLLQKLDLLDSEIITSQLSQRLRKRLQKIQLSSILPSTNQALLDQSPQARDRVVALAEFQTGGRGRRGRSWQSGYASGLCFSLGWQLPMREDIFPLISFLPAVTLAEMLTELGYPVGVKWPNDVLINGKKVSGVLIESTVSTDQNNLQSMSLVFGIGLNVYAQENAETQIDQPWIALDEIGSPPTRNALVVTILLRMISELDLIADKGAKDLIKRWSKFDVFRDQPVSVITEQGQQNGIARGINAQGALQLEVNKRIMIFSSAEVSLRSHDKTAD